MGVRRKGKAGRGDVAGRRVAGGGCGCYDMNDQGNHNR